MGVVCRIKFPRIQMRGDKEQGLDLNKQANDQRRETTVVLKHVHKFFGTLATKSGI